MPHEELIKLITKSIAEFEALPQAKQDTIRQAQQESYARGEMRWPKPQFHWENGVKVYHSMEDYYND